MRRVFPLCLTVLIFAGCGTRPPSVRIDPALAMLVPKGTVLLAGARLEALRATPAYRKFGVEALAGTLAGLELKDVWEILAVSDGRDTAVMARGKFAPSGLEPEISRPGATRTPYKGYTLIGLGESALVFMNPTTAAAGRPDALRSIIDQRGASAGPPAPLAAEIAAISPENQIWAAGIGARVAGMAPRTGNLANLATALKLIDRFHAAADLRSGARIGAVALCTSDRDAESLSGALNALIGFARIGNPGFARVSGAIRIEQQQSTVRIDGSLPEDVLESLLPR
jgi:hypothetical protein